MMFPGRVNWIERSDATGGLITQDNLANGNGVETAFEFVYAALLDLSEETCSTAVPADGRFDNDSEFDLLATHNYGMLGAAINNVRGAVEYASTPPRSAEPHYSGSSMDRLMSLHGDAAPLQSTDHQLVGTDDGAEQNGNSVHSTKSISQSVMPSASTGIFDRSELSTWMDAHALSRSSHHCAMYCRLGLEAAGLSTGDRPQSGDAGDYGPFLLRHGAKTVSPNSYDPQVGDVVVFDKTSSHPHGHIEMYDGQHWVSDFMQHSFSPYHDASSSPPFTIYRIVT